MAIALARVQDACRAPDLMKMAVLRSELSCPCRRKIRQAFQLPAARDESIQKDGILDRLQVSSSC